MTQPRGETQATPPLLERKRLMRRLGDPATAMTVVLAPAGYGKSTLMRQWQEADERPFVWISVDQRHDEATILIGAIAAELDQLEPIDERVFAPLMAPRPNLWSVVVPRLCDALEVRTKPFVLVLDDLHRVHDHRSLEPLAAIAEHMPLGSQIAISSRVDLAIPLGRLRTLRKVVEIQARDLAFTSSEAERVVSGLGIDLDEQSVEPILERTEGWPAGVYLAALVLAAAAERDAAAAELAGDDRLVADYLREEFIAGLPDEHRRFLTESSVLDPLEGSACDHVLERQGSAQLLKELARSNLLLTPLDGQDREYRLHGLLREMLATDLRNVDRGLESALRRRACEWYSEHDDVERAVPQAIASGDGNLAADLIWESTTPFMSSGRGALLERWLNEFSDAQTASLPQLAMARAVFLGTAGDGAGGEHWVAVAGEALRAAPQPDADLLLLIGSTLKASVAAREGVVAMREAVERAYELIPDDNPWRSLCCLIAGVSLHLSGERDEAVGWLEEGARRGLTQAPNVGMLSLAQLALVADDAGDPEESHRYAGEAMDAIDHFGLAHEGTTAMGLAVCALALAQRGRSDEASRSLRAALGLLGELNKMSDWYEAETRIVAARAQLLLDDVAEARATLAQAGRFIQRTADAPVLREWTEAAWKDADAAARSAGDRWPLSPAELRLLRFLPTHLSGREIAQRTFVSPNTVKSHTRAVYRKLGVSSRAEAVATARAAGLLEEGSPLPDPDEQTQPPTGTTRSG